LRWTRRLPAVRAALQPYLRDPVQGLRQTLEQWHADLAGRVAAGRTASGATLEEITLLLEAVQAPDVGAT
jgi:hypothetical protein